MNKPDKQKPTKGRTMEEGFIDLASTMQGAKHANAVFQCPHCNNVDLIKDASFQVKNPFTRGTGYFCSECGQTFDDSLVNLRKKPKAVNSIIAVNGNNYPNAVFFSYVQEDKGVIDVDQYDEYAKYDPEENADQFLINSGATILDSRIEITDSSGRNRIIVRRT